ncbi:MAG: hypothetical protein RL307_264, partial [Pseudomonadota bacterium]
LFELKGFDDGRDLLHEHPFSVGCGSASITIGNRITPILTEASVADSNAHR